MTDTTSTLQAFGAGGDEPYARALRSDGRLHLTDADHPGRAVTMDVGRWSADADRVDRTLLEGADGPVIDLGCGPGRMLVAAARMGLPSLGVDVSAEAVAIAQRSGGRAVQGSVFDPVPDEGFWDTALIIDGNIGIGGDPVALLERARDIVRVGGRIVVETHPDDDADRSYRATVTDTDGHASETFPWAEVGLHALLGYAGAAGLTLRQSWSDAGRAFCELVA